MKNRVRSIPSFHLSAFGVECVHQTGRCIHACQLAIEQGDFLVTISGFQPRPQHGRPMALAASIEQGKALALRWPEMSYGETRNDHKTGIVIYSHEKDSLPIGPFRGNGDGLLQLGSPRHYADARVAHTSRESAIPSTRPVAAGKIE
jgi:hypothetical protein